jgi:uncharacterized protein (DUF433 family)
MAREYIEDREGNHDLAGTRISLDSIVYAFRRGESPETICQNFELLRLEEVYGAIGYYLANHRKRLMRARDELHNRSPIVKVRFLADADLDKLS